MYHDEDAFALRDRDRKAPMFAVHERGEPTYEAILKQLSRRGDADLERVEPAVRAILSDVKSRGDDAVKDATERFELRRQSSVKMGEKEWRAIAKSCPANVREWLQAAADRIARYHEHQRDPGFRYEENGVQLGLRIRPVNAAGVYAPGGKARYPSSVLMTAVPARVAGVERIVLATPSPTAEVLAAAEIAGVTEVIDAGGAQAIGALAYGTQTIAAVDKIVGPGNLYVACAKRLVFGAVDIDGIAGPSEILVVADEGANPKIVAADLISQAEHDEDAYALLVTLTRSFADKVAAELALQLADLPRRAIAETSLRNNGMAIIVHDLDEAARVADLLAPEHLALAVRDPDSVFARIGAAGAVFLGDFTPEAAGDYVAGPSHVLPTGGAARFSSPLGVYDFVSRTSIIRYSRTELCAQADLIENLAALEGLEGHARAVRYRR